MSISYQELVEACKEACLDGAQKESETWKFFILNDPFVQKEWERRKSPGQEFSADDAGNLMSSMARELDELRNPGQLRDRIQRLLDENVQLRQELKSEQNQGHSTADRTLPHGRE